MAGLVYALRNQYQRPVHERHLIALESLQVGRAGLFKSFSLDMYIDFDLQSTHISQLYVPVAHALGLGSRLKEMEELSYKALFPESYDKFAIWHKNFADMGQVALLVARDRISHSIESHPDIRQHLESYEIQGRVKSVVSAFKKVFRKDKLPEELHDMLGLRIILRVRAATRLLLRVSSSSSSMADRVFLAGEEGSVISEEEEDGGLEAATGGRVVLTDQDTEGEEPDFDSLGAWVCHRVHQVVVSNWEEVPGR